MKKGVVFASGVATGIILSGLVLTLIFIFNVKNVDPHVTYAENEILFPDFNRAKIFQVTDNGALANCSDNVNCNSIFTGPVIYLPVEGQNMYYDDQIIEFPSDKKAVQIGTFSYETALGEKVVPIIEFK